MPFGTETKSTIVTDESTNSTESVIAKQRTAAERCFCFLVLISAARSAARTASPMPSFICVTMK